ncbi:type II secretion system protein [Candidatus Gottesmanbacteria bacterium]|nr:type II secretion system protein [Candidatus Gottesmanbacteria bacterium]
MKGFTFIELLIVIAVMVLLATIGTATSRILMQARDVKRASIMHDVQNALGLYDIRNGQYFNTTNDFCGVINILVTGNYLPVAPFDPKTQTAICGVGNSYIGGAMYNYTATPSSGTASSYVLTLVKESGGRADFYSPQ